MSYIPLPPVLAEEKGTYKSNPDRRRIELKADELDKTAPKHFTAAQKKCWDWYIDNAPYKILKEPDRVIIETAVILTCLMREQGADGMSAAKMAQLLVVLERLGCTPTGRLKMSVAVGTKAQQEAREKNPYVMFDVSADTEQKALQ